MAVAAGLCAVLAVAGCGDTVPGQASTTTSLTKADLYDPCTLPADAITAAGANPATKDDNPFLVARDAWKGCSWRANGYHLAVFNTTHTLADFRSNELFHNFRDIQLPQRRAVAYTIGDKTPPDSCDVTFETSSGTFQINASKFIDSKSTDDVCSIALQYAQVLDKWIPR
ncbi:DUF3558 family protein [Nocardia sp. R7R-8]|uniref:DUF3558 family protein n=1 Tax=Nocardia sp. R7R-8 TaxID=3459304 RepID=UPI00403D8FF9